MGCHTWFYKKSKRTIDEARKIFIDESKKNIKLREEVMLESDEYWEGSGFTKEDSEIWCKIVERQIQMVEKGLCDVAVYNKQPEISFITERGFFIEHGEYHDLFRKGGYPETKLYSLKETMDYINDPENHCTVFDFTNERLEEFWKECPDGSIEFG